MNTSELTEIRLNGELGKKFGRVHRFAVHSTAEAVRALSIMIPGFKRHMAASAANGVDYAVFVGKENIKRENLEYSNKGKTIKIVPILRGSKSGGIFSIIVGAILIVAAFIAPFVGAGAASPYLYMMGASMILGGVVQLLSPQQKINQKDNPNNGTSYNFTSPVNTTAQGNPVPLLYGEMTVGSAVVSGGIYAEDQN
jgi:predicted phage tail protein